MRLTGEYTKTMPSKTKIPTAAVKQAGTKDPAQSISLRPVWEQRLKELDAFKKEHGHCNVPAGYSLNTPLASWVSYTRRQKRTGVIAAELARRLDELGFTWVLRDRSVYRLDWDAMVVALTAFRKKHGHCCIPWQPAKYQAIAMWLINVRRRKKKGLLDRERIQQLDRLGVNWEPRKQKWEEMFAELVVYRAKYGDCNIPGGWSENPRLASWVMTQRTSRRQNTLTQDHRERLNKIGFVWTRNGEVWESKFAALVEYQQTHGHCRVSSISKDHASLGNWVRTMRGQRRRGKLREERIRRLDELGFEWNVKTPDGNKSL